MHLALVTLDLITFPLHQALYPPTLCTEGAYRFWFNKRWQEQVGREM